MAVEDLDLSGKSGEANKGEEGVTLDLSVRHDSGSESNQEELAAQAAAAAASQEAPDAAAQAAAEQQVTPTYEESGVLQYLSEKLGREVSSLDELTKKEERVLNPQLKAIEEWADRTGRPIEDWVKYNKDYSTMSNEDKAREILALKYPTLNSSEIELELNRYLESEDDLEEDVTRKSLELKKLIANDGKLLEDFKLELGKPVEGYGKIPEEIQEQLAFAKQAKEYFDKNLENQDAYNNSIKTAVEALPSLEIPLEEGLTLSYNLSQDEKRDLPSFISEMPHWRNADGSTNHQAVSRDGLIIKNFDKLIQMAYEQGKAKGIEAQVKDENNITLGNRGSAAAAQPDGGSQGVVIEGFDKFKGSGVRVKFGKRN